MREPVNFDMTLRAKGVGSSGSSAQHLALGQCSSV